MITGPVFHSFTDAYLAVLQHLLDDASYRTDTRGKSAVESLNASFTLADPVQRLVYSRARKANVVFNYAETLWYLSGRDDLDMIAHYAPALRKVSGDGLRLTGTAYGPKLFVPDGPGPRSQFERVLRLLRADPDTKRAAMPIMRADELDDPGNPDVSCTLGLQFLRRADRLHAVTYMRGNDAMIGLLGDTFAFTFIQEFTARLLGVPVGTYAHHVGSMHLNLNHRAKATAIVADPDRPTFAADPMPASASWDDIAAVLNWEERLRTDHDRFTGDPVGLHPYWSQIIALFEVHRQITHYPDQPLALDALDQLNPGHRWLVEHRWPAHLPHRAPS